MSTDSGGSTGVIGPILVFDGGCPFCRHFAERSALVGGIENLQICDGRSDPDLRRRLRQQGFALRDGAMLLVGERVLHGAEAIQWLCARMQPSDDLLQLLKGLMAKPERSRSLYPLLLAVRAMALRLKGLPIDPDQAAPEVDATVNC